MFGKIVLIFLIYLVSLSSNASQLSLQFAVNLNEKWVTIDNSTVFTNPNIAFTYNLLLDASNPTFNNWTYGGNIVNQTYVSLTDFPLDPVSADVQSHINVPLNPLPPPMAGVNLEYRPVGLFSGGPETYVGVNFSIYTNNYTSSNQQIVSTYQRSIGLSETLSGQFLGNFDTASFQSYMNTFVGNSNFSFSDGFMTQGINQGINVNDQYRYSGYATLISVTSVPINFSFSLFLSGIFFIKIMLKRCPFKSQLVL